MGRIFLVNFSDNWADEMDLDGWCVYAAADEAELKEILVPSKTKFPQVIYFGTNEENEYRDRVDLLSTFSWKEITYEESQVLHKLFGGSYGVWPELHEDYDETEDEDC